MVQAISFFVFFSVFLSVIYPILACQLPVLGYEVSPSVPQRLSFSLLLSFAFPSCLLCSLDVRQPRSGRI